jgi:spore maturation protein CgeB
MRILLIAPLFHGYSRAIGQALESRGHDVQLWHYDELRSPSEKLRHKLVHELPDLVRGEGGFVRLQEQTTQRAVEIVRNARPDVALVIKGDVLLPDFWQAASSSAGLTHLWLYDEVRRMRHSPTTFRMVDRLTTYSRLDRDRLVAEGLEVSYVANAFDDTLADVAPIPTPSFLFVGARYKNRERMMVELDRRGLPVLAVGRGWSHHPFDRARTWSWRRPDLPFLRDTPRADAYALMAGAAGNLNSHFDQDGFTMRTFEIPGMGGLQLIDRADVSEFYEPDDEVLVYDSVDELTELCQRAMRDRAWAASIGARARRRTLAEHTFAHRVPLLEEQWA